MSSFGLKRKGKPLETRDGHRDLVGRPVGHGGLYAPADNPGPPTRMLCDVADYRSEETE